MASVLKAMLDNEVVGDAIRAKLLLEFVTGCPAKFFREAAHSGDSKVRGGAWLHNPNEALIPRKHQCWTSIFKRLASGKMRAAAGRPGGRWPRCSGVL